MTSTAAEVFAGCVVTALQSAVESSSADDSRCIGSPVIIFNALRCGRATYRSPDRPLSTRSDRSVLLQDIPKPARERERHVSAALIPRYLATLFSLIRSFHFPCHGL